MIVKFIIIIIIIVMFGGGVLEHAGKGLNSPDYCQEDLTDYVLLEMAVHD